jgi:hypothetical protein
MAEISSAVLCLHNSVDLNGTKYDLYMGYMSPKDILQITKVPSFDPGKSNVQIAQGVPPHKDPVVDWQRPIDDVDVSATKLSKVSNIAKIYSDSKKQNLMPNPIILSINPLLKADPDVSIIPESVKEAGGLTVDDLFKLKFKFIKEDEQKGIVAKKPLWLLDGQHRTVGMMKTADWVPNGGIDRSNDKIPFILLHGDTYKPSQLAEIFTHVTSGATAMDPIHKEWMHYAFKLPVYNQKHMDDGMNATTELCIQSKFGDVADGGEIENPFYDRIQFNPKPSKAQGFYAFKFTSPSMASWIGNLYYKGNSNSLPPLDLAEQLAFCVRAFYELDNFRDGKKGGSRLFDNGSQALTGALAEPWMRACLAYLRHDCYAGMNFGEWKEHLSDTIRNFQDTKWNMTWVGDLDGADFNRAKKLAERVFLKYLRLSSTPTHKIGDYLQGTGASLEITAVHWDSVKKKKLENKKKFPSFTLPLPLAGAGLIFPLGHGGHNRVAFRVELPDGVDNIDILAVYDGEIIPSPKLSSATQKKSYNCDAELKIGPPTSVVDQFKILIETQAFSTSKRVVTKVRVDRK